MIPKINPILVIKFWVTKYSQEFWIGDQDSSGWITSDPENGRFSMKEWESILRSY